MERPARSQEERGEISVLRWPGRMRGNLPVLQHRLPTEGEHKHGALDGPEKRSMHVNMAA